MIQNFILTKNNFQVPRIPAKIKDINEAKSIIMQLSQTVNKIISSITTITVEEYADNTAAIAAGLNVGDIYRTGDELKIVHS